MESEAVSTGVNCRSALTAGFLPRWRFDRMMLINVDDVWRWQFQAVTVGRGGHVVQSVTWVTRRQVTRTAFRWARGVVLTSEKRSNWAVTSWPPLVNCLTKETATRVHDVHPSIHVYLISDDAKCRQINVFVVCALFCKSYWYNNVSCSGTLVLNVYWYIHLVLIQFHSFNCDNLRNSWSESGVLTW